MVAEGSPLLAPLLLGGCFLFTFDQHCIPAVERTAFSVLLAQQPDDQPGSAAPVGEQKAGPPRRSERNLGGAGQTRFAQDPIRKIRGRQRTEPVLSKTTR